MNSNFSNIIFVTWSKCKFQDAKDILSDISQQDIDLEEIQDIDPEKVIIHKINLAFSLIKQPCLVEDTSLCFDLLGGFPWPFIKWLWLSTPYENVANMLIKSWNTKVSAKSYIGYKKSENSIKFFYDKLDWNIVMPRGTNWFRWDVIFQPQGYDKTFAEMTTKEKAAIWPRQNAFRSLKNYLIW